MIDPLKSGLEYGDSVEITTVRSAVMGEDGVWRDNPPKRKTTSDAPFFSTHEPYNVNQHVADLEERVRQLEARLK